MKTTLVILFLGLTIVYCSPRKQTNPDQISDINDFKREGKTFVKKNLKEFKEQAVNDGQLKSFFNHFKTFLKKAQDSNHLLSLVWHDLSYVMDVISDKFNPEVFPRQLVQMMDRLDNFQKHSEITTAILDYAYDWITERANDVKDKNISKELYYIREGLTKAKYYCEKSVKNIEQDFEKLFQLIQDNRSDEILQILMSLKYMVHTKDVIELTDEIIYRIDGLANHVIIKPGETFELINEGKEFVYKGLQEFTSLAAKGSDVKEFYKHLEDYVRKAYNYMVSDGIQGIVNNFETAVIEEIDIIAFNELIRTNQEYQDVSNMIGYRFDFAIKWIEERINFVIKESENKALLEIRMQLIHMKYILDSETNIIQKLNDRISQLINGVNHDLNVSVHSDSDQSVSMEMDGDQEMEEQETKSVEVEIVELYGELKQLIQGNNFSSETKGVLEKIRSLRE